MPNSTSNNARIDVIDAFRGFALAGIVLVHFVEQFIGGQIPQEVTKNMLQGIPDYIVTGILQLFFIGKFFALFSILFGLSFYIQIQRARQKGTKYSLRFLWRITILMAIGLCHALFYRGDILTIYAMLAIFLPLFQNVSNKWLLVIADFFFLGLGRFTVFAINGNAGFFGMMDFDPDSQIAKDYFNILQNGSILEVFKDNITNGLLMKLEFQFGTFNRGYLTFALFLVGMWLGRIQLFENAVRWKSKISNMMWYFLGIALVCIIIGAVLFSQLPQPIDFESLPTMLGMQMFDMANLGLTGFILCLFLTVYAGKKGSELRILAPYGRTALTNYVMQSIIGTFLFYGWGLGYITQVRNAYTFLIAILVIIVQVWISKIWMQKFNYGPLEWVWRCLTWGRLMPILKTRQDIDQQATE